jgi:hypothetical protein
MARVAVASLAASGAVPADNTEALLRRLLEEQARQAGILADILRALDRGRARDTADAGLLLAIEDARADRPFNCADIIATAGVRPGLNDALVAADVTNGQELGCLFRRIEGMVLAGVRLERVDDTRSRAGIVWRVQVCEVNVTNLARP